MSQEAPQNDRKRTIDQFQADYNASPAQPSPFSPPVQSPASARSPAEQSTFKSPQGQIPSFANLNGSFNNSGATARRDVMSQSLPYSPQPSPHFQAPQQPLPQPLPSPSQPQISQQQQQQQQQPPSTPLQPHQQPQQQERSTPSQPGERRQLDVKDLSDLVATSGIDIAEEERYLASYGNTQGQSWASSQSTRPYGSSQTSFDVLSQSLHQGSGAERESFRSQAEQLRDQSHRIAARKLAEKKSTHLNDPFLLGALLARRIENLTAQNGATVDLQGLFHAESGTHPDAPSILERAPNKSKFPLEDMLSTLSLAANERIRGLLEDAYGLARARQTHSDGVVPADWADIAVQSGTSKTTVAANGISGTSWDDPVHGGAETQHSLPSPPASVNSNIPLAEQKRPTVQRLPRQNPMAIALTKISQQEKLAEEARLKKRQERNSRKNIASASTTLALQEGGSGTVTGAVTPDGTLTATGVPTGLLGDKAPEAKLTKKQRETAAKAGMNEDVAHRNANRTAAMQTGARTYSWMTGGKAAAKPGLPKPTPAGSPAPTTSAAASASNPKPAPATRDREQFGDWREDGAQGRGLSLRDWASVLEVDGRAQKSLAFAYARMHTELENEAKRPTS